MKKLILLILLLLMLCSCGKKELIEEDVSKEVKMDEIIKKIDENKEYVYFSDFIEIYLNNGYLYDLNLLEINLNSDDVKNINLEIKSFVNNSYKKFQYENEKITSGNYIDYEYYVTNDIISVIIKNNYYVNNMFVLEKDIIYSIDIETGASLNNEELLMKYEMTEEDYVESYGILQYAHSNYTITKKTILDGSSLEKDGDLNKLTLILHPTKSTVNLVVQMQTMSNSAVSYKGGSVTFMLWFDDNFVIRKAGVTETYKAKGMACSAETTDTYYYGEEQGFVSYPTTQGYENPEVRTEHFGE